jgi:hypothetical protein
MSPIFISGLRLLVRLHSSRHFSWFRAELPQVFRKPHGSSLLKIAHRLLSPAGIGGRKMLLTVRLLLTRAASMRRPAHVKSKFGRFNDTVSTPTNGRRDHPSNAFLLRKVFDRASDDADRRPAGGAANLRPSQNLPSPNRPASIRTLVGAHWLRCQLGSSIYNGCCHLSIELICLRCRLRSFHRALAVTRTRRFCANQNP